MKNFNFDVFAKDLDGTDTTTKLGKILAIALVNQPKGDALKFYHWALAMQAGQTLIVDASDLEILKAFIRDSETINVIAKAQILEIIYAAPYYTANDTEGSTAVNTNQ